MTETYRIRSKAVFTGLEERPRPATIVVCGKRIKEVLPWNTLADDRNEPLYDYGDQLVMPSFIDAHTHIFSGAINASPYVADLSTARSEEECVQMIAEFAKAHPHLESIRGTGWFVGNWGDAPLPNKRSLDAVISDRPVYLQCADAHSMWLNTKALEESGIVPNPNLTNGIIETFANGELSGMLIEPAAYAPAMTRYMDFNKAEMLEIHKHFQQLVASYGIGALSEMFADDYTKETYSRYEVLKALEKEQALKTHIYIYTKLFGYTSFDKYFKMKDDFDSEHIHIAGVKGFVDGVTETYTGLLLEPYEDRPQTCGEGLPLWPKEKMQEEIVAANRVGIQVRLHCIGDGAVRLALDLYETARAVNGDLDVRNTIEHIENIHPDDIARFAPLKVIPSMQPYHLILTNNAKIFRIGAKRCQYEWALRSIWEKNRKLAIGTDYPVVTLNPFQTIYAAVTRKDDKGLLSGHNPWETLSLTEVLKAYTQGAAYLYHEEESMGTLEKGKLANVIVLNQDLFQVDVEAIKETKVVANFFEGRLIYKNESVHSDV